MSVWSVAATAAFVLLGVLSVLLLLVHLQRERTLNRSGVRVHGRVTERTALFHSAGASLGNGVEHRIKSEQRTGHRVGDSVVVIYQPDRPQRARIDAVVERWHGTISGTVFLAISIFGAMTMIALGMFGVF
jgi:hypothetical protein